VKEEIVLKYMKRKVSLFPEYSELKLENKKKLSVRLIVKQIVVILRERGFRSKQFIVLKSVRKRILCAPLLCLDAFHSITEEREKKGNFRAINLE
jgi:hypothetical protein